MEPRKNHSAPNKAPLAIASKILTLVERLEKYGDHRGLKSDANVRRPKIRPAKIDISNE
jgi:hypothetical protein